MNKCYTTEKNIRSSRPQVEGGYIFLCLSDKIQKNKKTKYINKSNGLELYSPFHVNDV